MKLHHAWPKGHWAWPIQVTHQHGVRCGSMIWAGGQLDMTESGEVCRAGDLFAQVPQVARHLGNVLTELDSELSDLVKLLCFYVNDGSVDERDLLAAITAVPVAYLAYPGIAIEMEGYAMRGEDGEDLPRNLAPPKGLTPLSDRFAPALR